MPAISKKLYPTPAPMSLHYIHFIPTVRSTQISQISQNINNQRFRSSRPILQKSIVLTWILLRASFAYQFRVYKRPTLSQRNRTLPALLFITLPLYPNGKRKKAMAELQKKVETDSAPVAEPVPVTTEPPLAEAPVAPPEAAEKKVVVAPVPPPPEPAAQETKALAAVEKTPEPAKRQISGGSLDRDIALAEVEKEKRLSYVKAWEESEKSKAENKAQKQLSAVDALENSKKAAIEAKLKKIEEQLERKKAEYAEKMRNKIALVHKEAEEKRAMVEAKRGEEMLKAEEMAAKFRATGTTPKKAFGCF